MNARGEVLQRAATLSIDEEGPRVEALGLFPVESLQHLDAESARLCQAILGHGDTFGVWETPYAMIQYMPPTARRINLRQRIRASLPAETETTSALDVLLDEGVLWLTRLGLLMRMGPAGIGKSKHQLLDASTVAAILYGKVNSIVARGIVRRLATPTQPSRGFAVALTPEDVGEFRATRYMKNSLRRLTALQERDLWTDAPPTTKFTGKTTSPRGAAEKRQPEPKSIPFQPIPDDYLAAIGPRVLWLILDLGPNLVHLLETLPTRLSNINFSSTTESNSLKTKRCLAGYFEEHIWRDREGTAIIKPPFPIRHGSYRGSNKAANPLDPFEWPIQNWASVANLAVTLQSSHLWITLLMMAGRIGEVMTLPRDCIEWARDGKPYANGKTYKLKLALAGEKRQWPAPDILVDVLAQQVKLVEACERLAQIRKGSGDEDFLVREREHLWASLGSSPRSDAEARLGEANTALRNLATRIGMTSKPGGKNLHAHRFRKTIGRLAGLAIDGSPKVLMRLLGHKDITMTLGYVLTDPAFAKEVDDITREMRIMRTQGLVEDMHTALHTADSLPYGGHGGGGASALSTAVRTYEEELHRTGKKWGVDSAHELAVLLTNNGQSVRLVFPNVVCTKSDGEISECSKKKGPVIACKCESDCGNRIEEKTGRRDTQLIIPIVVSNAQQAIADNDWLAAASYARQLSIELKRFDDIGAQWRDTPEVAAIMEAVK